jgi:hypothetical protein
MTILGMISMEWAYSKTLGNIRGHFSTSSIRVRINLKYKKDKLE